MSDNEHKCVMCKKAFESATGDWTTSQPHAGGEIELRFAFGSTKFDWHIGRTIFLGLICDDCAEPMIADMKMTGHGQSMNPAT